MERIYLSIVSHDNDDDIINNLNLREVSSLKNVTIIIRDNLSSQRLKLFCIKNKIEYSSSEIQLGFGANNNINFKIASDLGMNEEDWFILVNPDINISAIMMNELSIALINRSSRLFAINLYFDENFSKMEYSLRKYPTFYSLLNILKRKSFTDIYDKENLEDGSLVDWAAGSFLIFQSRLYKSLNGFDENYFMYFEDVDICYRARFFQNQYVTYLKKIKATHKGGYKNRNLFSKHFRWYVSSLVRFLIKRKFVMDVK